MKMWNRLTTPFGPKADMLDFIEDVYQKLISRNGGRGQIQAAFAQAAPVLVGEYNQSMR